MIKLQEKRERKLEGYLTLEASLIMPLVLYVCIFIIYAGFYQYDRCIMQQDIYRAALRGSSLYGANQSERYRAAADMMEELTRDNYVAAEYRYEISVRNSVSIFMEGRIRMPFQGLAELTGAREWEIEETAESRRLDPVLFIRTCRQLGISGKK